MDRHHQHVVSALHVGYYSVSTFYNEPNLTSNILFTVHI